MKKSNCKNNNKRAFINVLLSLLMVLSVTIAAGNFSLKAYGESDNGIGAKSFSWQREIAQNVKLSHEVGINALGDQRVYTVEYDPKESTSITPITAYGTTVMGGKNLSTLAMQAEDEGYNVVAAINGDFYDTSNMIAAGIMIKNGKLIKSASGSTALGFYEDGTAVFGVPNVKMDAIIGNNSISINHYNSQRKFETNQVFLNSIEYNNETKSLSDGVEVTLSLANQFDGVRIGGEFTATVMKKSIVGSPAPGSSNSTPIGEGEMVISTHTSGANYAALNNLTLGSSITIRTSCTDSYGRKPFGGNHADWSKVYQSIGAGAILIEDGQRNLGAEQDTAYHPRTAVGIKADGKIVLFQNDGRQANFAAGLTYRHMNDYLLEMGCVWAFNLDGGGSSTIMARIPGDEDSVLLNTPSDGGERANANGMVFVAKTSPTGNLSKLHLYSDETNNYGNKVMILENSALGFTLKATDENYFPVALGDGAGVTYSCDTSIGTMSGNQLLAKSGYGTGKVNATKDGLVAEFNIDVVDKISQLKSALTAVSVKPTGTRQLAFQAFNNGVNVMMTNESLKFSVEPASLGRVDSHGLFTAEDTSGTGVLTVSYKELSISLPIEIGKLPVDISGFEGSLTELDWGYNYVNTHNGGTGSMSINTDERFVKYGDSSLKIDYDFATKPLTGTISIEGNVNWSDSQSITLEGEPIAIGCWVYGDGNGAWFRIQATGGKYVGNEYITWKGWRYIETPIPQDVPKPVTIVRSVRLLGTASVANGKKGTVYVDGLRAVYDFKNDDRTDATIIGEPSPSAGTTVSSNQPQIKAVIADIAGDDGKYTGINTTRTKLFINGKQMTNLQQNVEPDGSVTVIYEPSALTQFRPGLQKAKLKFEDNYGNISYKEWSFTVEGYSVDLLEEVPLNDNLFIGSKFDYAINNTNYKGFNSLDLEIEYNKDVVELVASEVDSRINTITSEIIEGNVKLVLAGMSGVNTLDNTVLRLKFIVRAKGDTGIRVNRAHVLEDNYIEMKEIILDGYSVPCDNRYTVSYTGSTVLGTTEISVVNEFGEKVTGAKVTAKDSQGNEISEFDCITGDNGKATTDYFGKQTVNSSFSLQVDIGDFTSNIVSLTVRESLSTAIPEKIMLTAGQDPSRQIGISWQTNFDAVTSEIVLGIKGSDMTLPENAVVFQAQKQRIVTVFGGEDREYYGWSLRINDLSPDTVYLYKVGNEAQGYTVTQSFRTASATGKQTIAVFGDIQGAYAQFADTYAKALQTAGEIDINLIAGDVVDNGQMFTEWNDLKTFSKEYFESGLWMSAIGNHDVYYSAAAYSSTFIHPTNGVDTTNRTAFIEMGDAIIAIYDTESPESFPTQNVWLKKIMDSSTKAFKIVLMHRSAYPLSYDEGYIRDLAPVFEDCKINLVLSGHDHIYNRTTMFKSEKVSVNKGVTYVVTGTSSGGKYYDASLGRPWEDVVYDDNNRVFNLLTLDSGLLTYKMFAIEGNEIVERDSFVLNQTLRIEKQSSTNGQIESEDFVDYNGSLDISVTANIGYLVKKVLVNGAEISLTNGKFTIANITTHTTIAAEFEKIQLPEDKPEDKPDDKPNDAPIVSTGCGAEAGQGALTTLSLTLTALIICIVAIRRKRVKPRRR